MITDPAGRRRLPAPPLMIITARSLASHPLETVAQKAFRAGARWISVREKDLPLTEQIALVNALESAAPPVAVVGLHGDGAIAGHSLRAVHLPRDGDVETARAAVGEDGLVGISCHSGEALEKAAAAGVDYATLSPIFASRSKPGHGPVLGIERFSALCALSPVPVLALAGINASNAAECMQAGASGIAVMGEVMRADDPGATVRGLLAALDRPAGLR